MKYDQLNIDDLFLLARKGDGTAFEQIVLQTEKQVYNLALSITRSREDAEDAAQETYLRLWRNIAETSGVTSFKYYILRIARNCAVDILRNKSKQNETETLIQTSKGEFEPDIIDTSPESRPDEAYWSKVRRETVRECIAELPLHMRELIILREIDGLSYLEIAQMLSIPEGSVRSGLSRAREKLRQLIISKNIL